MARYLVQGLLFQQGSLISCRKVLTTDGIRRRMHIANWRAGMTAKKLLRNRNLVDQI